MKLLRLLNLFVRDGVRRLESDSRARISAFVDDQELATGGYHGPDPGPSDLYYTLFGTACAAALHRLWLPVRLRRYLSTIPANGHDLVHSAALAVLRRFALMRPPRIAVPDFQAQDGGFSHLPGQRVSGTAYGAYIGLMLCEALGKAFPRAAVGAPPDGPAGKQLDIVQKPAASTTTNLSAALAVAVIKGGGTGADALRRQLFDLVLTDGGFPPWGGGEADLLSTASAVCALRLSGGLPNQLRPGLARFIHSCWTDSGGFRPAPDQGVPDVEYTYYALLALGCV